MKSENSFVGSEFRGTKKDGDLLKPAYQTMYKPNKVKTQQRFLTLGSTGDDVLQ